MPGAVGEAGAGHPLAQSALFEEVPFPSFYPAGWGEHGRVLWPKALDTLFRLLKAAEFSSSTPGMLLTDRGGIGLCWEHRQGNSVEVEFTGTGAELYHAATKEEGVVAFD
jgi:hypothetical protein